jgi:hypothetical protein
MYGLGMSDRQIAGQELWHVILQLTRRYT